MPTDAELLAQARALAREAADADAEATATLNATASSGDFDKPKFLAALQRRRLAQDELVALLLTEKP